MFVRPASMILASPSPPAHQPTRTTKLKTNAATTATAPSAQGHPPAVPPRPIVAPLHPSTSAPLGFQAARSSRPLSSSPSSGGGSGGSGGSLSPSALAAQQLEHDLLAPFFATSGTRTLSGSNKTHRLAPITRTTPPPKALTPTPTTATPAAASIRTVAASPPQHATLSTAVATTIASTLTSTAASSGTSKSPTSRPPYAAIASRSNSPRITPTPFAAPILNSPAAGPVTAAVAPLSDEFPSLSVAAASKPSSRRNSPVIKPQQPSTGSNIGSPTLNSSEIPPVTAISSSTSSPVIRSRTIPLHIFQGTSVEAMPTLFLPTQAVKALAAQNAMATAAVNAKAIEQEDEDFESATIERIHLREHFNAFHAPSPAIPIAVAAATTASKAAVSSPIHFPPSPSPVHGPLTASPSFDFNDIVRAESLSFSLAAASSTTRDTFQSGEDDEWLESSESMVHTPASFSHTPSSTSFEPQPDDLDFSIAARRSSASLKAQRRMIDANQHFAADIAISEDPEFDDEFVVVE